MDNNEEEVEKMELLHIFVLLQHVVASINFTCAQFMIVMNAAMEYNQPRLNTARSPHPFRIQLDNLNRLVYTNEVDCFDQLRLSKAAFMKLCTMTRGVGLSDSKYVVVEEKLAMFLAILAHHKKNRVVKHDFRRSGQTVSKYFNEVLLAVIRLHGVLLKVPEPIPANCTDDRWKWFQNCLGAIDGTYIAVRVAAADKPRYRTRKGEIATNVMGVCAPDTQFIYVLPGWEGSASDSRVLRDAISREHGLKVPIGHYYLVDAGYTNGEGFLAPYRGQRYHLSTWRLGAPRPNTPQEYFNMKHASARNVVERTFGILKSRWAILRSHSFFPIRTQCRIITACCLLHNHITREMPNDRFAQVDHNQQETHGIDEEDECIDVVEATDQWSEWRTTLATQMFDEWQATRAHGI